MTMRTARRTLPSQVQSDNALLGLASPVLELILRVRSGQLVPSSDMRRTVDDLLADLEERGLAAGYLERQVRSAKFVLAAFIDELVLTTDFPLRAEWEKTPLQLEYFGEHLAGVKAFERLDEHMDNGEADVDVVEIYYVCLLLGYKGKYKIYLEDELRGVIADVADFLRRANRLRAGALSPHWMATDQPELPPEEPWLPHWARVGAPIAVAVVFLLWMLLFALLQRDVNSALESLQR
jgi:type VI secretion system protein ImpK